MLSLRPASQGLSEEMSEATWPKYEGFMRPNLSGSGFSVLCCFVISKFRHREVANTLTIVGASKR